MTTNHEKLVTVSELAARCGVARSTVRQWARTGRAPSVTLPSGRIRFRPEDVAELMPKEAPDGRR